MGEWDDFKSAVRCTWECQMPGDGSLEASLAAVPFISIVGVEAATARVGAKLYDRFHTGGLVQVFRNTTECSMRGLGQTYLAIGPARHQPSCFQSSSTMLRAQCSILGVRNEAGLRADR
jgi:hypothetical protein